MQKHPAPVQEQAPDLRVPAVKEHLVGREKVIKLFKKLRPESADEYLSSHGL